MRRLKRELITGAQFQQEFMILRQERINQVNRVLEHRRLEGLGEKVAEIDAEFYWQMVEQYGHGCWADPAFMEDTLKKNPGMRLRINRPVRISIDGFAGSGDERDKRAAGNRAARRTPDAFPGTVRGESARYPTVQVIEHSAARDSLRTENPSVSAQNARATHNTLPPQNARATQ